MMAKLYVTMKTDNLVIGNTGRIKETLLFSFFITFDGDLKFRHLK